MGQPQGGVGPSLASQGFVNGSGNPSIYALAPQIEGIENVSFNDFTLGVDTTGLKEANNTFQVSENFSKVMGTHLLKVGVGFHIDQVNINPDATYNGAFSFTGAETGSDFADFLSGHPQQLCARGLPGVLSSRQIRGDLCAGQLAGQAASDAQLRLALGSAPGLAGEIQSTPDPGAGRAVSGLSGSARMAWCFLVTRGFLRRWPRRNTLTLLLASAWHTPRITRGAGWAGLLGSPGTTSVRAGYGLYYTAFEGLSAGIMSANPPYGYDYTSLAPPLFSNPFVTAASGQNIGQRFPEPIPAFGASAANPNSSVNWSQYLPITGVPSFFHQNVPPYSESYTLSLERQIDRNTLLSLAYVGSQAHHLLVLISANPATQPNV